MKQAIYKLVEKGSHGSFINRLFDYFIMLLIVLNLIAMILETMPEMAPYKPMLHKFDVFSIIVFSIEYLMRLYVSDLMYPHLSRGRAMLKYIFSPMGLVDLCALLPFYVPFLLDIDLRFMRLLRVLRFLRILKLSRYNMAMNLIGSVIREKRTELSATMFVTLLVIIMASFFVYHAEHQVQPDKYSSIPASFWWAVATLTTIGYGDVYPITVEGKIISGLIAILGIGLVALPTAIISVGFMEKIKRKTAPTQFCPHCGKPIQKHIEIDTGIENQ